MSYRHTRNSQRSAVTALSGQPLATVTTPSVTLVRPLTAEIAEKYASNPLHVVDSLHEFSALRVGIVGSGYIARGLALSLSAVSDIVVTKVLTRSDVNLRGESVWHDILTNSVDELIDNAELIVECTGDPLYGTDVLARVMAAGLPIVTMNTELQVTTGSYFARRGLISEAEGDQPGSLAALHEDVVQMGFQPLVYGNMKGFLNLNPTREDMAYWAERQGISLPLVTAFTDGTKVQYEQALVANGLGADIYQPGLLGPVVASVEDGGNQLAQKAEELGRPISDYILTSTTSGLKLPAGVFITATHAAAQQEFLRYYKLGSGPYYTISRDFHLPHLEIVKTIRRVMDGRGVLLNNGLQPVCGIAAIAKHALPAGMLIERSIGSFDLRGSAVRIQDEPDHVPLGLLSGAILKQGVDPGQQIRFRDVDIPESLALTAWRETLALSLVDAASS